MKKLVLSWQKPESHHWFPIGCLEFDGEEYRFFYVQGVKQAKNNGFTEIYSLPDLNRVYSSTHLFPLFSNRLMSRSRPDYQKYIESLNIPEGEDDPISVLARSGGIKATDRYEIFPYPEIDKNGIYCNHFFVDNLQYLPKPHTVSLATKNDCQNPELVVGDILYLSHDLCNFDNPQALLLQTENHCKLGYCPPYLSQDIFPIFQQYPQQVRVKIDRVNLPPAPLQSRLLCTLTANCGLDFVPFRGEDYQPLVTSTRTLISRC
jgi:hypothetical protein